MSIIRSADKDYDLDQLSDEAKAQLWNLRLVDVGLQRLNAKAAVLQPARLAYAHGPLQDLLSKGRPDLSELVVSKMK